MITINAITRHNCGKSSSKKLRKNNKTPAIIYGNNIKPIHIIIMQNEIINKKNNKDFYSILNLILDKKKIKVKIQDIQYHPFKNKFVHIDFIIIN
ncbi:50S ribosomal protein L25 [Candidatus Providencia siddallii]|uniref:Large ribosomal subunit protein bL25 n=1 Tax=Candidatus Providencia siddallii TaxID=1715285 RepID=A0ABM9NNA8_9GAMM